MKEILIWGYADVLFPNASKGIMHCYLHASRTSIRLECHPYTLRPVSVSLLTSTDIPDPDDMGFCAKLVYAAKQ